MSTRDKVPKEQSKRRVVLGLGNILNSDEGFGVHILNMLSQTLNPPPDGIEFLDGGALGLNLLPLVESCGCLLILDAVNAGQTPGSLIELNSEDIPLYTSVKLSQHQIKFQEVLALARFRDTLPPHIHLIGVQPADLAVGIDLSPVVAAVIPEVIERVTRVLLSWGLLTI